MAELGKFRITFFVAITTSIGYILYSGEITLQMLLASFGVFLLASGSSALNHIQEKIPDSKMDRTKGRPLPSGRISNSGALLYAAVLAAGGFTAILFSSNLTAAVLGLLALFWYNIIYSSFELHNSLC